LGVVCVGFRITFFGDDGYTAVVGGSARKGETRNAAANDKKIRLDDRRAV
jgi:hypothetical protein